MLQPFAAPVIAFGARQALGQLKAQVRSTSGSVYARVLVAVALHHLEERGTDQPAALILSELRTQSLDLVTHSFVNSVGKVRGRRFIEKPREVRVHLLGSGRLLLRSVALSVGIARGQLCCARLGIAWQRCVKVLGLLVAGADRSERAFLDETSQAFCAHRRLKNPFIGHALREPAGLLDLPVAIGSMGL
ncbi:hypothetical protein FQZ97_1029330 [compost metagenome]